MNATFPKSERLCSKNVIDDVFANGNARRSGGFTVKFLRDNVVVETGRDPSLPKLLISVPKRFQKRAVDRNRTKRLIREVYRNCKSEYLSKSGVYSLVIIYASTKVPDYSFVEEHLLKILERIK
ncbi:MAG: ribonuclease P protein component [Bacteroidales bacterium]|jgi:ribonuclease P protein component|nr:ribonuclease P protein component [Bacteroidales bacterium]